MNNLIIRAARNWQIPISVVLLLGSSVAMAVQPQSTPAQFNINGHIESFVLDSCAAPPSALNNAAYASITTADSLSCTATVVVNGQSITLPANTVITFPATFLTPYETFAWNPNCTTTCSETGLAIQDNNRLPNNTNPATYEANIQGNVVYDASGNPQYIAGLVAISQQDLNTAEGFINFIDYGTGEIRVGGNLGDNASGARLRLNDPVGRFGRSTGPLGASSDTQDVRFAVDDGNPTITAETGYPLCIPRSAAPDPLCPETNRPLAPGNIPGTAIPAHLGTFVMDCVRNSPPNNTCVQAPAASPVNFPAVVPGTDPTQQAPLEVGDYIVYAGTHAVDAQGKYISVHTISANLGIYTTPGTDPAYMTQEVTIAGVGTTNGFAGPAEGREIFKIVGFTTDVARPVDTGKLMTDPCDGSEAFVRITTQFPNGSTLDPTGAAAANVPFGRFRTTFLKGTALATPIRPAPKEIQTQIVGANPGGTLTANGLLHGQYTAPVSEYVFAENLGFGGLPIVPNNFEDFPFLALGHGPWDLYDPYAVLNFASSPIQGQLNPWPGSPTPPSVNCAGGGVAPPVIVADNLTVSSGAAVTINASGSFSLAPGAVLNYSWQQVLGPLEIPVGIPAPTSPTLSFTAPIVAAGAAPKVLTFDLTVTDITSLKSSTKTITVTVNSTATVDTLIFAAAPTYRTKDGSWNVSVNGGAGANTNATVSIEATNGSGVVVIPKQAMAHTAGTLAWTYTNKTVVALGTPQALTVKITSSLGGSITAPVTIRTN